MDLRQLDRVINVLLGSDLETESPESEKIIRAWWRLGFFVRHREGLRFVSRTSEADLHKEVPILGQPRPVRLIRRSIIFWWYLFSFLFAVASTHASRLANIDFLDLMKLLGDYYVPVSYLVFQPFYFYFRGRRGCLELRFYSLLETATLTALTFFGLVVVTLQN